MNCIPKRTLQNRAENDIGRLRILTSESLTSTNVSASEVPLPPPLALDASPPFAIDASPPAPVDKRPSPSPANLKINVFLPSPTGEDGQGVPAIDIIVHCHEGNSAYATIGPLNPITGSLDLTSAPHPWPPSPDPRPMSPGPRSMSPRPFRTFEHPRGSRSPSPCSTARTSVNDNSEVQESCAPSVHWINSTDVAALRQSFADQFSLTSHPDNPRFRYGLDHGQDRQAIAPSMAPQFIVGPLPSNMDARAENLQDHQHRDCPQDRGNDNHKGSTSHHYQRSARR
ncbi:MAG: hypothetical protein BYD32DRAFT_481191 [Podila humilis]|nr:MAG: hypothetical protein BYD32DRAFT_481191 [Podila humilis]